MVQYPTLSYYTYIYIYHIRMRIFVAAPDETGTIRKTRLTVVDCNTTNQLLKRISAHCAVDCCWLVVKLRQDTVNGWALEVYPLRQGSEILVEVLPGGLKPESPIMSPSKLGQIDEENELQIEDTNTTGFPDQKTSFSSDSNVQYDWTKYFQQSLQQFLASIRKQSLQQSNTILKSEPQCNDEKVLTRIMQKKIKFLLNETGECGRTALHWAIQEKNLDMVEFLLIKGSDPNVVSVDQYTPLQLAIVLRASSIFQTLVAHPRIDMNKVTKKGTALHVAAENSLFQYAQKLLSNGANPLIQNQSGQNFQKFCQNHNLTPSQNLTLNPTQKQPPTLPFILRGTLYRVSSFASRLKQRLLLANPFTNEFILFEQKTPQFNISLKSIDVVKEIRERSWGMKKEYFYWGVFGSGEEIVLCVRNQVVGRSWVDGLRKCVGYCKGLKDKVNVPLVDQFIQVLDDTTNTVKVHKHKLPNATPKQNPRASKKMNFLQLKPLEDEPTSTKPNPKIATSNTVTTNIANPTASNPQPYPSTITTPSTISTPTSQIQPEYSYPIPIPMPEQHEPDYLRQSSLLGSVISNQMLLKSVFGRGDSLRQSVFEDRGRAIVCFKDFQILRELGSGSFGRVFLARYRRNQRLFALKVLNKKKLIAKKQLKYAVGEANILKKVDSPFIIKLHYSFQTATNLYIALDYCPNGDLSQLLNQQQKLSERVCKFYIAQLILAVEYLHKNKIIYRDLKPENILIGEDGFIRLTDFNLSKENNFGMSFCGSPAYLSPEMLDKKGVGFEADIYGIGCVLYEMLVGQPPFFDDNLQTLYQNIRTSKLKFPSQMSKPAKSLISGLLQRNPQKRLGSQNIQQLKSHEFFHTIDWQKLQKLQIKLPLQLQQKITDKAQTLHVIQEHGFQDSDYQSNGSMINRIKNFTFVREIEDCGPSRKDSM